MSIIIPYNQLTEKIKESIIDLYYQNEPYKDIAIKLNVSGRAIPRVLKESGINTKLKNRYTLNENYFEDIDTEDKAYWLGFIYADGYVGNSYFNNLVILLSKIDKNHLEKFKLAIDYTGSIRNAGKGGFENSQDRYAINFTSKKMTSDLRKLGLYPGKSLTMTKMPELKEDLIRHFIRGYFDGDGSIYTSRTTSYFKDKKYQYQKIEVSIIGTELFLNEIKTYMPYSYFRIKESKTPEMKYLVFYGVNEMKSIYDFFYNESTVFLDRKHEKYTELLGPLTS